MITRACLYCLLGALAYGALLTTIPKSMVRRGATDQQVNYVRVEQVVYANPVPDNVIVGSSIAGTLRSEQLGPAFGLMALGAGASETGVEILLRSGTRPKRLFVESNVIVKSLDKDMIDYFTSLPMGWLRRWVPLLRQSSQPVNLLLSAVQHFRAPPERVSIPAQLGVGLENFREAYRQLPETNAWRKSLSELKRHLQRLQALGCEVVLVEYPIHPDLIDTPKERFVRAELAAALPEPAFRWLRPPPADKWETTDGIHLTSDSARRFARLLRETAEANGSRRASETQGRATRTDLRTHLPDSPKAAP